MRAGLAPDEHGGTEPAEQDEDGDGEREDDEGRDRADACNEQAELEEDRRIDGAAEDPPDDLAGDGPALELPEGGDLDAIEDVSTLGSDDDDEADEPRIDALALDDDLVEDAMEDLIGSVSSEDLEGLMLDDSAELEGSGEADEPSKDAQPEAGPAPKRSRGRGWLRGRLS